MLEFKLWLEHDAGKAVKIALPKVRMQRDGACGAQAFRAICLYYNVGPEDEKEFIRLLGTTKDGTWPENIVRCAKEFGFNVRSKINMTIGELAEYLDKNIPVICAIQAWGNPKKYHKDDNGHYVVVVGYDKTKIYFEDSLIDDKRGFLTHKEFLKRWHDIDAHKHDCNRLGIAMWMDEPKKRKKIDKARHLD